MNRQVLSSEEVKKIWKQACAELQPQLTPAVYRFWILNNPLTDIEIRKHGAMGKITSPTAFHATHLKKNLYSQLKTAIENALKKKIELSFLVGEPISASNETGQKSTSKIFPGLSTTKAREGVKTTMMENKPLPSNTNVISPTVEELFSSHNIQASIQDRAINKARLVGLRLDYTFKTFAVSTTNEMAHAAASAVSNRPGQAYNPLFLYGGVGVGKTHLMHAIGHNVLQNNSETDVIYCTGEEFTNEIVSAIQTKKAINFKRKYRNTSVLLIDDVQFIAGKNAVQEEFFHTFNALIKQSSQIVMTSDRPPHEINLLKDRLRSRFEAGLMIDIQQPSFELRTAILLIKAKSSNISIPMELAQLIASKVDSARKIEGIINLIRSEAELKKRDINQALIEEILNNETEKKKPLRVKPNDIIKTVANHYRVKQSAVKGKSRTKELVKARHVAMYLLRKELNISLVEIGNWFSNRDHTSVLHAIKKIEKMIRKNNPVQQDISALRMSLSSISR